MFDGRWREKVDRQHRPGRQVAWSAIGVTADVLTASGLVFAVATAVAVGSGHLLLGVPLLILTGLPDLLDGPVAKASGTSSVRGAFFDSVTDRVSDAVLMGGVAWYLVSVGRGPPGRPAAGHPGRDLPDLLPALEGRGPRAVGGQGRADGAGRAHDPARRRVPGLLAAGARCSGSSWPCPGHRRRAGSSGCGRRPRGRPPPAERPATAATPRWRPGQVESRWRAWRQGALRPAAAAPRAGEPLGRWRARRQEALASRSGRALRARRAVEKHPGRAARVSERRAQATRGSAAADRRRD